MADLPSASRPGDARPPPPGVPATYRYPRVPVTRLLDDAAKDFPETDAVDSAGHRLTYREIVDQVDRLATALRGLGVEPGDRVGLLLPHSPQYLITFFASLRAGATVVLLDGESTALEEEINATGCRVVVCLASSYQRLADLKGRLPTVRHILATGPEDYLPFPRNVALPVTGWRDGRYKRIARSEGVTRFKDVIRRTAPEPLVVSADAPALVCGGLVFEHDALVAGAFQLRLWVPDVQAGQERLLTDLPSSEPFAIGVLLGLGVLAASTVVFPARPEGPPARVARQTAPTLLASRASTIADFAKDPEALRSLRVGLAGAPVEPAVSKTIHDAIGARVRGGLATAGVPGLAHANPVYGRAKPGSAGLALSDTRTVTLAPDGTPLPAGETGVVAVQGPQVAGRRWGGAEGTESALSGAWLRTARRGRLDEDGYLWLE